MHSRGNAKTLNCTLLVTSSDKLYLNNLPYLIETYAHITTSQPSCFLITCDVTYLQTDYPILADGQEVHTQLHSVPGCELSALRREMPQVRPSCTRLPRHMSPAREEKLRVLCHCGWHHAVVPALLLRTSTCDLRNAGSTSTSEKEPFEEALRRRSRGAVGELRHLRALVSPHLCPVQR